MRPSDCVSKHRLEQSLGTPIDTNPQHKYIDAHHSECILYMASGNKSPAHFRVIPRHGHMAVSHAGPIAISFFNNACRAKQLWCNGARNADGALCRSCLPVIAAAWERVAGKWVANQQIIFIKAIHPSELSDDSNILSFTYKCSCAREGISSYENIVFPASVEWKYKRNIPTTIGSC